MAQLEFSEQDHVYKIDGVTVPSVTELCAIFGNDADDPFLENAIEISADRGVTCHKVLELLLSGVDIDDIDYPDVYAEYVESIQVFLAENEIEPIAAEIPICDPEIGVAGTPDLLCMFNGDLTIIDYKFVAQVCKPKVKAQLNAYDRLYRANDVHADRLLCVQFLKCKPRIYEVAQDDFEFAIAYEVHKIKNKKHSRGRID